MADHARALVIEDDDDIRLLLRMVLGQAGFSVETAATGEEGASRAEGSEYGLITIDVGLPDIDGLEVARRIRPAFSGRIVIVSARASNADESAGLAAGADLYIKKPFRPSELRKAFESLMSSEHS